MNKTRRNMEGAMLTALYIIILLLALYAPVIGGFVLFLLPIPIAIFFARHDFKTGILILVTTTILSLLISPAYSIFTVLISNMAGAVMGYLIYRRSSFGKLFWLLSLTFSIEILLSYKFSEFLIGYNLFDEIIEEFNAVYQMFLNNDLYRSLMNEEAYNQFMVLMADFMDFLPHSIPLLMFFVGIANAYIALVFTKLIFRRLNLWMQEIPQITDWKFPKWMAYLFLVYFIFVAVSSYIPYDFTYLFRNLSIIFFYVFVVQGLSVALFYVKFHKMNGLFTFLVLFMFFMQFGQLILQMIGIFEIVGDLRKMIVLKHRNKMLAERQN